jgi:hypothetical protein
VRSKVDGGGPALPLLVISTVLYLVLLIVTLMWSSAMPQETSFLGKVGETPVLAVLTLAQVVVVAVLTLAYAVAVATVL